MDELITTIQVQAAVIADLRARLIQERENNAKLRQELKDKSP